MDVSSRTNVWNCIHSYYLAATNLTKRTRTNTALLVRSSPVWLALPSVGYKRNLQLSTVLKFIARSIKLLERLRQSTRFVSRMQRQKFFFTKLTKGRGNSKLHWSTKFNFFFGTRGKISNPNRTFNAEFKCVSCFFPSPTVCLWEPS